MFRKHFLMGSNGLDSSGNIYGYYDWCVRYTAKKRIHPFGIPISDIKPILESQGYTVVDDNLYWVMEDDSGNSYKYPVNLTHNVWNPITKEGIFGFIGPEPGMFAAIMGNIVDSEGKSVDLRVGFNSLNEDLSLKQDYDVTKVICPDSTHITATILCFYVNCYFFALEDYIWPKNLGFLESHFDTIDPGCPYMKKPFIFKSTWTTDVDVGEALDFPSSTPNAYKYIVESGNPVYDSRNDCGCIIKTETDTLMVGSTMGFVPDTVTHVYRSAFLDNKYIEDIRISKSVTHINKDAFMGCSSLKNVYITDVGSWCNITFGNEYSNPLNTSSSLYLNDILVTNLIIPDSVTNIGNSAFSNYTKLTSVEIPNSVTSIGQGAFEGCSGLTSVVIGDSVNSIEDDTFRGCSKLTSVVIPNSVTNIGYYAFYNCSGLTSVEIGNSVTNIGYEAFYNCVGLTSVVIPNSVTSIGSYAFERCSGLTSVEIGNSVTSIDERAFSGCSGLTSVVWNAVNYPNFSSYSSNPFYYIREQITSFKFGNSVEHIPARMCYQMSNLTSVEIGNSVTSIGQYAFYDCSKLTSVEIGDSVTSIGEHAFYGCDKLTSIEIPNSVISIGQYAFYSCESLTSITIPNSVNSIGQYAFNRCSELTSIIVDETNPIYDSRNDCNAIIETETNTLISGCKNTIIPNSVTSIGKNAFSGCSGLTSVVIPNSVTNIGDSAFYNCVGITSVVISDSVTNIGSSAFSSCWNIISVEIGNSVTNIGNYAFQSCSELTSVVITSTTPPSLGQSVFSSASSNLIIYVPDESVDTYKSATNWSSYASKIKPISEKPV